MLYRSLFYTLVLIVLTACGGGGGAVADPPYQLAIAANKTTINIDTDKITEFSVPLVLADDGSESVYLTILNQPERGLLWVEGDGRTLHYDPAGSLDYLKDGETYQETIRYSVEAGDQQWSGDAIISVTGIDTPDECLDLPIVNIDLAADFHHVESVAEGHCVSLDTTAIDSAEQAGWAAWTTESRGDGAGNSTSALFSYIGHDRSNPQLVFLPPSSGYYSFSWCPEKNECFASGRDVSMVSF